MRLLCENKALSELYKDYRSLNDEDKADFYDAKCDYYRCIAAIGLVSSALISIFYLIPDYITNGSIMPTFLPRLSVAIAAVIFILLTRKLKKRLAVVITDLFFSHFIFIASLWAMYHLDDKLHAGGFFLIINFLFMAVSLVSKYQETVLSGILIIIEILVSNIFMEYEDIGTVLLLQIPCILSVIVFQSLITLLFLDHYRVRQKLELANITDPLTQVYNRHLLERIITQNALKDINGPVAIAMLDIDYFKQVNDEHGHYTGDQTLLYIGQKLSKETHDNDFVIRYGGEEFVIILKNCDVNNACARMEQFRRDIEDSSDTPVPITISAGVSRYTGDFTKTIQNVNKALLKAKNTGRNKVVVV